MLLHCHQDGDVVVSLGPLAGLINAGQSFVHTILFNTDVGKGVTFSAAAAGNNGNISDLKYTFSQAGQADKVAFTPVSLGFESVSSTEVISSTESS